MHSDLKNYRIILDSFILHIKKNFSRSMEFKKISFELYRVHLYMMRQR